MLSFGKYKGQPHLPLRSHVYLSQKHGINNAERLLFILLLWEITLTLHQSPVPGLDKYLSIVVSVETLSSAVQIEFKTYNYSNKSRHRSIFFSGNE